MGMIGVLEITLIVPTLRVGMPLRTLRVRSRMWRRCVPKLQRYPRGAMGTISIRKGHALTRHGPFFLRSETFMAYGPAIHLARLCRPLTPSLAVARFR